MQDLEKQLSTSGTYAMLRLDRLDPEVAMALHSYADNENANYKSAAFFFTAVADAGTVVEPQGNGEEEGRERGNLALAEDLLKGKWVGELGDVSFLWGFKIFSSASVFCSFFTSLHDYCSIKI